MFHLAKDNGIINWYGFNLSGMNVVANNLFKFKQIQKERNTYHKNSVLDIVRVESGSAIGLHINPHLEKANNIAKIFLTFIFIESFDFILFMKR